MLDMVYIIIKNIIYSIDMLHSHVQVAGNK